MSHLLELLALLQPENDGEALSSRTLLKTVLPALQEVLPKARTVRVMRRTRNGVALWGSTSADETLNRVLMFDSYPHYQSILDDKKSLHDEENARLLLPLSNGQEANGVLEVQFQEELPDDETIRNLERFAYQLGVNLDQRRLNELISQQTQALDKLVYADSFERIARIMADVLLEQGQFISINLFERDDVGNLKDIKTVITANRKETIQTDAPYEYDKPYLSVLYTLLDGVDDFLVADVQLEPSLNDRLRDWLTELHIQSVYAMPLRNQDNELYGFIGLNDTLRAIALSDSEARIYRNLATQASFTIQNQNLIQQVTDEAEEARILYAITRDLLAIQDISDILPIVKQYLGKVTNGVQYIEIQYDDADKISDVLVRYEMQGDSDEVSGMNRSIMALFDDETLQKVRHYWLDMGTNVEIYEDLSQHDGFVPMSDVLQARGIASVVTFPVVDEVNGRMQRIGQISLNWRERQFFEPVYRRLANTLQSQMTLVVQNQHFLERVRASAEASVEQVELLRNLNTIASTSNETQDELKFLQTIVPILQETTQVDHIGITLIQDNGEVGVVVAEHPEGNAMGQEVDITGDVFVRMREDQKPVLIHNTQQSDVLTDNTKAILKMVGVEHLLIQPLFNIDGELIGTIGLDLYDSKARFTAEMQNVAQTVSSQIATSLQKLRLLQDTRLQVEQMHIVNEFGQTVQATQDVAEILMLALKYTQRIVGTEYLAMVRYEDGDFWRMPYSEDGKNVPSERNETLQARTVAVLEQVAEARTPLVIQDHRYHQPAVDYPLFDRYLSLILLPVLAQGQLVGIVEIANKQAYSYRASDIASLEQMTNQFGAALLNARTYSQTRRLAQNRAHANDISIQLQQQADVQSMLNITVTELGKILNAKRGRIRLGVNVPKDDTSTASNE
jgi:GAF domain-containing protein